jgi:transcriptional regulator with GAF, ATPase, and Fis domain
MLNKDENMATRRSKVIDEPSPEHLLSLVTDLQSLIDSYVSNLKSAPGDDDGLSIPAQLANISENIAALLSRRDGNAASVKEEDGASESTPRGLLTHLDSSHQITYCSQLMHDLIAKAERAATYETPVLLVGETGVGKELIARLIHKRSPRKRANWSPVNCAAITKELFESHLFGHKQGAFTGATRDQVGVIRAASGGTLFLDEIGELPIELQPKLLRFLQIGEIHTIGHSHPSFVNVRVIASTNRDLESEVAAGKFRADLFYRLNSLSLRVPALRDRREDIPLLIDYFVNKFSLRSANRRIYFTAEAIDCLKDYDWPGNVRELSNLVLHMLAFSESRAGIQGSDLPPEFTRPKPESPAAKAAENDTSPLDLLAVVTQPETTLAESIYLLERHKVSQALSCHKGNFARAARQLGLSTFGLRKKYRRLFPPPSNTTTPGSNGQPD